MPKTSKTQELKEELDAVKTNYEKRISELENKIIVSRKLEKPMQWYEYIGYAVLILMVLGMLYLIWLWVMSEQGHNVWFPNWLLK
jgi:hypothetical protein